SLPIGALAVAAGVLMLAAVHRGLVSSLPAPLHAPWAFTAACAAAFFLAAGAWYQWVYSGMVHGFDKTAAAVAVVAPIVVVGVGVWRTMTAGPVQLIGMLYDGGLDNAALGIAADAFSWTVAIAAGIIALWMGGSAASFAASHRLRSRDIRKYVNAVAEGDGAADRRPLTTLIGASAGSVRVSASARVLAALEWRRRRARLRAWVERTQVRALSTRTGAVLWSATVILVGRPAAALARALDRLAVALHARASHSSGRPPTPLPGRPGPSWGLTERLQEAQREAEAAEQRVERLKRAIDEWYADYDRVGPQELWPRPADAAP
ncbi:MAG TPA: hypothetical protein VM582_09850, partial [Candidatus Thermoplasmatota archaeon]|nr:hypothetical protein [Candidatus Thermoplasmatota archaeon]